mgnify:CR=1 FL=1|jgi:outer membrane protein OmpA-like peptidoglycan-associated protein
MSTKHLFLVALINSTLFQPCIAEDMPTAHSTKITTEFETQCQSKVAYFDNNRAKIAPDFVKLIRNELLNGILNECPDLFIVITGHTSASETNRFGLKLSKRRALAVKSLFVRSGVPSDRIVVRWVGGKYATDLTKNGQLLSQKVEIDFWRSKMNP